MRGEPAQKRRYGIEPAVAAALVVLPCLFLVPVTHDAIWQVWIGRQLLGGAKLYRDIVEINPPLWFWMAMPLAGIGEIFGIAARPLIIGFFVAAIALALYLTPRRFRLLAMPVMALLPLQDFAQREHFALISTIPYALLIASRASGERPRHPLAVGLFAAFGFALKPYFILVPIALELLVWNRPRIRPETAALAAAAAVYAAAVLILAPDYLTHVVPMARRAYGAFIGEFTSPVLVALSLVLTAIGAAIGRRRGTPASRALLLTALAFLPAVILQGKGWSYQTLPVRGFLFLAIAAELVASRRNPIGDAFLAAAAVLCVLPIGVYKNYFRPEIEAHLRGVAPGTSIIVLASDPSTAWPMVEEHRLRWELSQFCLWQMAAATKDPRLEADLRRIVARDLQKRPEILIINRRSVLGMSASALVPAGYLDGYALKLSSPRFVSYKRLQK